MDNIVALTAIEERIHKNYAEAGRFSRLALETVILIGDDLIAAKEVLGHGNFLPWVEERFDWGKRSAQAFMQVAEKAKTQSFAHLNVPVSAAYLLAAPSTPVEAVEAVAERSAQREQLSGDDVKDVVATAKAKNPKKTRPRAPSPPTANSAPAGIPTVVDHAADEPTEVMDPEERVRVIERGIGVPDFRMDEEGTRKNIVPLARVIHDLNRAWPGLLEEVQARYGKDDDGKLILSEEHFHAVAITGAVNTLIECGGDPEEVKRMQNYNGGPHFELVELDKASAVLAVLRNRKVERPGRPKRTASPRRREPMGADGKFASRSATPSPSHRRAKRLEAVDGRTVAGKRVAELRELFTAELTSAGAELSPLRRLKIDQAANAIAVAELARSRYLQNGSGDLSDLVSAERRADAAIKRLGLPPEGPSTARAPELREYLGGKVGGG